ncbi:MAG: type II toxin-antitoxin system RelE/ParE family toxin [Crocinitomix sp.]|nr:type II toxin-antitoxin system RelE/ParE family toxin [Crocinitomix sp.]
MVYDLVLLPSASKEVQETLLWYEEQQKGLEARFYKELQIAFNEITKDPDLFQKRYRDVRIRFLKKFKYGVHYQVNQNLIIVLAVVHTAQKPRK